MNPAMKEATTLLLGRCDNERSIREPTQHFGPNGTHQSSIEIAVDQRQHIGKAGQIGVEFVSIFKRMAARKNLNVAYRMGFRLNWQIARDLM
jgi:hypothetical protein